jgi:hypothetical protein
VISVTQDIVIYRPVDEVFAFACDPANDPLWMATTIESAPQVAGPLEVGTRVAQFGKFLARPVRTVAEVVEYKVGRRLCLRSVDSPIPYHDCRTVTPQQADARFTRVVEADIGDYFRMAEPLVELAARYQVEADLRVLKIILDARADVGV